MKPFIIALLLVSLSCSRSIDGKDSGVRNTEDVYPDSVSLTDLAWKMRNDGESSEKFIETQRRAVRQMREGLSHDDPVAVLDQMGFFYNIVGDYRNALKYYAEAGDSLRTRDVSMRGEGAIMHFGDVSSLCGLLGMYDDAIRYSDSAIVESKRQNGLMLSDVYRFRAGVYQLKGDLAEAGRCYDLALDAVEKGRTRADKELLKGLILSDKACVLLEMYPDNRDSVDYVVNAIEGTLDFEDINDDRLFTLGLAYVCQGKLKKGLELMRKMARKFKVEGDIELQEYASRTLMDIYVRHRMYNDIVELYPEYRAISDSMMNEEKAKALVGAMVMYNVDAKEDKNTILQLQLETQREKNIVGFVAASFIFMLLAGIAAILFMRNRLLNYKRLLSEHRLAEANDRNSKLMGRVDLLEHEISAGMNSNSSILSSPQLITGESEGKFRRAFNVVYPGFLVGLKQEYPQISPNDELLCMLLYLKHTTEEISLYLGISRASVNSARYRLRVKFALPKDVELDGFIQSREA